MGNLILAVVFAVAGVFALALSALFPRALAKWRWFGRHGPRPSRGGIAAAGLGALGLAALLAGLVPAGLIALVLLIALLAIIAGFLHDLLATGAKKPAPAAGPAEHSREDVRARRRRRRKVR